MSRAALRGPQPRGQRRDRGGWGDTQSLRNHTTTGTFLAQHLVGHKAVPGHGSLAGVPPAALGLSAAGTGSPRGP